MLAVLAFIIIATTDGTTKMSKIVWRILS